MFPSKKLLQVKWEMYGEWEKSLKTTLSFRKTNVALVTERVNLFLVKPLVCASVFYNYINKIGTKKEWYYSFRIHRKQFRSIPRSVNTNINDRRRCWISNDDVRTWSERVNDDVRKRKRARYEGRTGKNGSTILPGLRPDVEKQQWCIWKHTSNRYFVV